MLVEDRKILEAFNVDVDEVATGAEFEIVRFTNTNTTGSFESEVLIHDLSTRHYDMKNCIFIRRGWEYDSSAYMDDGNNVIITLTEGNGYNILAKLVELGVNVPAGIDETRLCYRRLPDKNSIIERVLFSGQSRDFAYLGRNSSIGISGDVKHHDLKTLLSIGGVKVGDNVHIGNNVIIYRGVTEMTVIKDDTWIPDNVIIHHGAIVGGVLKPFNEYF